MTTLRGSAVVLALGIGCLAPAPAALASSGNAAATLAYLRADRTLLHASSTNLPVAESDLDSFVAHVTGECPDVAAQAPSGEDLDEFEEESGYAAGVVFEAPNKTAWLTFARDVEHLHWSSRNLTSLVRQYAVMDRTEAELAPPDLCAELREWAGDSYSPLPQSTSRFVSEATPANPQSEVQILMALPRYAGAGAKTLLSSVKALYVHVERQLVKLALPAISRLQEGLGLQRGSA